MKIAIFKKFGFAIVFFAALAALIAPLHTARAGVFSFIESIWEGSEIANAASSWENSQNMSLLQPAINPNPAPIGGGDITIADNTTLVPESGPTGGGPDLYKDEFSQDKVSIYVVREGDTLSQIAKMFNVSVNTIVWSNDIDSRIIRPGQTLVILPISGIQHTVKKGDTLKSISTKYKADLDEILQYNGLKSDSTIAVGDVVVVPDGVLSAPASSAPARSSVSRTIANYPSISGYYMRPVSGGRKSQGIHGYNGVDLAAPVGTPILASAAGKVVISRASGWNGGYGQYIVISHDNGTQTLYAHLSQNYVVSGQWVEQGAVIGAMGSTGRSTGSHIHFEVRGAKNPF